MIGQIFGAIQLILRAFQLWDAFLDWMSVEHIEEIEERRQRREQAIDRQKNAKDEDEFDKAQDDIVNP